MTRVAITGLGIVDPLGYNIDQCFDNSLNDFNPIKPITHFDLQDYHNVKIPIAAEVDPEGCDYSDIPNDERKNLPDYVKLAVHAVGQAIKDSGNNSNNAAVIFSSLGADHWRREAFFKTLIERKSRYSPKSLLQFAYDYVSGYLCRLYNLNGINTSFSSSCSTSIISIDYARKLTNQYDFVVVGAADAMVDPGHMFWFQNLGAMSTEKSCPFDQTRSGFVMGEGAGCLILESEEKALARGAKIYGFITGVGLASDNESATSPTQEGLGGQLAVNRALDEANINTVDFVSAHATSTPAGDEIEYSVIRKFFPTVPIYSLKGKIGHTMGPCGVIEIIHAIKSLHKGIVPKNYNLANSIAPTDTMLLKENLKICARSFLKNSYGFAGKCATIIVEKD